MRTIVHLDADAFFAAVEQASDPKLRGKPIAVGGEKRGIIASASYEARKFGVYTPMPTMRARKLCPKLIVLPGDFERYEQFSTWMFSYAYDFTPDVEQTSIDEGYFDLSAIRVPLTRMKGLTSHTTAAILDARKRGPFTSFADFFQRVAPSGEELEAMIRCGAFDEFKDTRTRQFWQAQHLLKTFGDSAESSQGWLISPPGLEQLPGIPLNEPTRRQCLEWETDLFGFAVSGHPLELFADVAWKTYCPINRLGEFVGQTITTCGLVVEQRTHHQLTGEPMKFLSLADWTGIVETELFAQTYKSYGLATVRYPVLEIEAQVEPFDNQRGFSLRVIRANKPRSNCRET